MGVKVCIVCGEGKLLSEFVAASKNADGRHVVCKICYVAYNATANAKRRILCGNEITHCEGMRVEKAARESGTWCKRHVQYQGREFDIFDIPAFQKWFRDHWFKGATLDRIDSRIGYVCRMGDVIDSTRFGNMRLVTAKENQANKKAA